MKTTFLLALAALALSACAPRYYDDRAVSDRYYEPRGHIEYTDRDRYNDRYNNSRDYDQVRRRDRDSDDRN